APAPVEGALLGPQPLHPRHGGQAARPDARGQGDRASRVPVRGGAEGGRHRVHGRDHQDGQGEPEGIALGRRHPAQPRQSPGPRVPAGPRGREPGRLLLRLQHDVPHRPSAPPLGPREPPGRAAGQRGGGAGTDRRGRPHRPRPDAGDQLTAPETHAGPPAEVPRTTLVLVVLIVLAPVLLLLGAALTGRGMETDLPATGDYAALELYTRLAAQGRQLLGPYSRVGVHPTRTPAITLTR